MSEKRVLLVDDNPSDRMIVKLLTEKNGFIATEAQDGHQALNELGDQNFALFVVDLQMPKMPGLQLVRRLRNVPELKKTPILIMSGRNRAVDVQMAIQSGATDYIVKPMDLQVLEEKINRLTKGSSEEWKRYAVPEPLRVTQAGMFMNTLSINEIGAEVHSNLELPLGHTFMFNLEILNEKGLKDSLVKVETVKRELEGYVYKVLFIGLTEADRKKIRLCCRDLWLSTNAENEAKK